MAIGVDSVQITPGSGQGVAGDTLAGEAGSPFVQALKLVLGSDGVAQAFLALGQALSASSLPVTVASDQSAVPVSGTFYQATQAVSLATAPALVASDAVIGLVGASDIVVTITPTIEAAAYTAGDLIFDATEVANAVRANGGHAILQSLTLLDKSDQGVALTLVFANAATDFGALNGAPDPDDTEAATVIGYVPVATGDYIDLGAAKVACVKNIGLLLKAGAATTSLYVAAINGTGAPTYASTSDLVLQLGFLRS